MSILTTCREVHQLTSESLDRKLGLGESTRVRLHLLGCPACRTFGHQMELLREAMRRLEPGNETDHGEQQ